MSKNGCANEQTTLENQALTTNLADRTHGVALKICGTGISDQDRCALSCRESQPSTGSRSIKKEKQHVAHDGKIARAIHDHVTAMARAGRIANAIRLSFSQPIGLRSELAHIFGVLYGL